MIAADDLSQCPAVLMKASNILHGKTGTLREAIGAFRTAHMEARAEIAASTVLGTFRMSMSEFKEKGKEKFTTQVFNQLSKEIKGVQIDCEFLVCGQDEKRAPHIFSIDSAGKVFIHDVVGFHAIGSGGPAAITMLLWLGQKSVLTQADTIFNVYAAKFMAESPGVVGERSYLYIKEFGCMGSVFPTDLDATMRKWWDEKGKPRKDEQVVEHIRRGHFEFIPPLPKDVYL
jgi:hypothetical protein